MIIDHTEVNGTPVFTVETRGTDPWKRVWGAVRAGPAWLFPAFYPCGYWALTDLRVVSGAVPMTEAAVEAAETLRATHARVAELTAEYAARKAVTLRLPQGHDFKVEPFPHQQYGLALAVAHWRLFFLWEMRTGKTKTMLEALRLLRRLGRFRRAVVVGPPVVRAVWEAETEVHAPGEFATYAWEPTDPERERKGRAADLVLVSYDGVRNEDDAAESAYAALRAIQTRAVRGTDADVERLTALARNPLHHLGHDVIVGDESHQFGNFESRRTQAMLRLADLAPRRYALSGTAGDQPFKFFSQLRFLSRGLMPMEWDAFKARFAITSRENKHVIVGFKHLDEINARVDKVATRMKQADCQRLTERTVQDLRFDLGPYQKTRYNQLVREMRATELPAVLDWLEDYAEAPLAVPPEGGEVGFAPDADPKVLLRVPHGAARLTKLMQVASGFLIKGADQSICENCPNLFPCAEEGVQPYTPRCVVAQEAPPEEVIRDFENPKRELLKNLLAHVTEEDPTCKVIVWALFRPSLDDVAAVFAELGLAAEKIQASSIPKVRALQVRFRDDPALRGVYGQVSSGIGIDLSPANVTVFYDLTWDRVHYQQAIERDAGPRQRRDRRVFRLLARETVTEYMPVALEFKDRTAYALTEKIACASCGEQARCVRERNAPFRGGCIYQPETYRPKTPVEEIA